MQNGRCSSIGGELCKIVTRVILGTQWQQTLHIALLGPLLREGGLVRAASFCDLTRLSHHFSRGVNSDGKAVSPLDNLAAI